MKEWQAMHLNNSNTDGDKSSSKSSRINEPWLLKNIPVLPVRGFIHVALVSSANILFGPQVPQEMCTQTPSFVMTQTSPTAGRGCDPFCDVPNTCIYDGHGEIYGSAEGPPRGVENRNLLSHPDDLRKEAYLIRMT